MNTSRNISCPQWVFVVLLCRTSISATRKKKKTLHVKEISSLSLSPSPPPFYFFLNRILCYLAGFHLQPHTYSEVTVLRLSSHIATQLRKDSRDSYSVSLAWHIPQIIMNAWGSEPGGGHSRPDTSWPLLNCLQEGQELGARTINTATCFLWPPGEQAWPLMTCSGNVTEVLPILLFPEKLWDNKNNSG